MGSFWVRAGQCGGNARSAKKGLDFFGEIREGNSYHEQSRPLGLFLVTQTAFGLKTAVWVVECVDGIGCE